MHRPGLLIVLLAGLFQAAPLFAQDLSQPYVEGRVLVRFAPGAAAADRAATRNALLPTGGRAFDLVPGLELVTTQLDVLQAIAVLSNNSNVLYVEPDYIVQPVQWYPNDEHFADHQWGLDNQGQLIPVGVEGVTPTPGDPIADIDMPEAWDELAAPLATGTLVAVIDTGTQADHPDLAGNVVGGWDFFDNDNNPDDEEGHGTHVAGTIAALTNNTIGVAGVCPGCPVVPLRFLGPNGGSNSDAIDAINYAVVNNIKVSNNSWGGGGNSQALYDAIKAAGDEGHIFVAAAGNSGTDTDVFPHYPSSYGRVSAYPAQLPLWNLISVAATTHHDDRANFSNFGAASVDLGAPGHYIASTYMNSEYWWNWGTSMAAPHVTGVVAILMALEENGNLASSSDPDCPSSWDSGARGVVQRVLDTVRPATSMAGITVTGGVLNAYNAVAGICYEPVAPPPSLDDPPGSFAASDGGNGTAEASWDDVDGATEYWLERREKRGKNRWINATVFTIPSSQTHSVNDPYVDSTVAVGKTYRYRVAGANATDSSPMTSWSEEVTISDGGGGGGGEEEPPQKCHPRKGC